MMTNVKPIRYRKGLKYQLVEDAYFKLKFVPHHPIVTDYITFDRDGWLTCRKGYAWDGPSGPTHDDKTNMRGSLMHDACYQLMRMGLLERTYRPHVDLAFKNICLEDGMSLLRAGMYFEGVHLFGEQYAERQQEHIYGAP